MLLAGYAAPEPATGGPLFAFRLHQFVSRGDTVYASLEPEDARYLTMEVRSTCPGDRDKRLLPAGLLPRVRPGVLRRRPPARRRRASKPGRTARARRFRAERQPRAAVGLPLPRSRRRLASCDRRLDERLPEAWLEPAKDGVLRLKYALAQDRVPRRSPCGRTATSMRARRGRAHRLVRARAVPLLPPLRRRLRASQKPTSASWPSLATEGRSHRHHGALTGHRARPARRDRRSQREARKLLSFTDNRQDASLQAGHFNDFVQVGLLRGGALSRRVRDGRTRGISHDEHRPPRRRGAWPSPSRVRLQPGRRLTCNAGRAKRRCATCSATASTGTCAAAGASPRPTSSRPGCSRRLRRARRVCADEDVWRERASVASGATPAERATPARPCSTSSAASSRSRRPTSIRAHRTRSRTRRYSVPEAPWALDRTRSCRRRVSCASARRDAGERGYQAAITRRTRARPIPASHGTWREPALDCSSTTSELDALAADLLGVLAYAGLIEAVGEDRKQKQPLLPAQRRARCAGSRGRARRNPISSD